MATFIYPAQSVTISGGATEAKQDVIITGIDDINSELDTQTTRLTSIDTNITKADTDNVVISSALPAGDNNIGNVDVVTLPSLPAGSNNIGDVDVVSLPSLPAGTNNIGDVDVLTLPSIPAGSNNIGSVDVNPVTPQDYLDAGVLDSSSTNIPAAGVSVVSSLAANVTELEIIEDIGELMVLTDASDTILTYLPLGGGRVKVSIAASTGLKLASVSGATITTGKIAINFLG
jgi:hypothetical protein